MKHDGYTLSALLLALALVCGMLLCNLPTRSAASSAASLRSSAERPELPKLNSRLEAIAQASSHPY